MCEETREIKDNNSEREASYCCVGCLGCLPTEVLEIILSYLSVVDYIRVRTVCKCWWLAFSRCRPEAIESSSAQGMLPWFVVLKQFGESGLANNKPFFYGTCGILGDLSTQRIYETNIPELCGMQFRLSRYGWLLLQHPESCSLFFLNPFSRARINLPPLDLPQKSHPVFGVSAPPTSSDCKLFVISYYWTSNHKPCVLVATCLRGETEWTVMNKFDDYLSMGDDRRSFVTNTVFLNGVWYCIHDNGKLSSFDTTESWEWRKVPLTNYPEHSRFSIPVSFVMKLQGQTHLCVENLDKSYEVVLDTLFCRPNKGEELKDDLRVSIKDAIIKWQGSIQMDSFSEYACCALFDNDQTAGNIRFSWHWYGDRKHGACRRFRVPCNMVCWFLPRWVPHSSNLDWSRF